MDLPVKPPVSSRCWPSRSPTIPAGQLYEPKWDGFRSIIFRDGDEVEIGSRNEKPMTRYFPEVVEAVLANFPDRAVIDGEIIVADTERNTLDFEALQQRIHPAASRVKLLAEQTPASFVAFDLLALGDEDLTERPFARAPRAAASRRWRTRSRRSTSPRPPRTWTTARRWFDEFEGAGLDGLIAKSRDLLYQPDKRVMSKIKHKRTADCVVAGYRVHKSGRRPDRLAAARPVRRRGTCCVSVGRDRRVPDGASARSCSSELQHLVTTFDGHPWNWAAHEQGERTPRKNEVSRWNNGKDLSFVPLRPERVVEVRYDYMEGDPVPAHRPVRALAARPGAALVHVRAAGAAGAGSISPTC